MTDFLADIAKFHEKYGLKYEGKPRLLPRELKWFRDIFLAEEVREYKNHDCKDGEPVDVNDHADVTYALEEALDALVDLAYVLFGTAYLHGFNFEEAWKRVHEANMKKERVLTPLESKRGSAYDVVKPKNWVPPSHTDLVEDHAHKK